MNSRIKLKLRNPAPTDTFINPVWLTGNDLYFDTDESFGISLSKEIQTLTDINKITVETALDTSLPATLKNLAILGISMDIESMDNTYPEHEVEMITGFNELAQNKLRVLGYDKSSNRIEIELLDDTDNWIVKLKEIFLDDLDFGEFEYTQANLEANFEGNDKFIDGDPGYYFGHCFYGRYVKPGILSEGDLRPLVHAKKILDLTSVAIGKKLVAPILETEYGRRIVHYLIKPDFLQDKELLNLRRFRADFVTNQTTNLAITGDTPQNVKFPQEIIDTGNNYDPATGLFTGVGIFNFTARIYPVIHITAGNSDGTSFFSFTLAVLKQDGTEDILQEQEWHNRDDDFIFREDWPDDYLTLTYDNVLVKPGEKAYVRYKRSDGDVTEARILKGSTFSCEPVRLLIQPGDVINIGNQLRHDLVLDYLKGMCHIFKWMIYDDKFANTIYFLTPYDLDFFGDSLTGYFKSTQKDWKPFQVVDSEKYIQKTKIEKNRIYQFKKSTDAKITSLKLEENNALFSKFVDNGFDRKSELENFENPYFEPTYSSGDPTYQGIGLDILNAGQTLPVPYLVDNLDNDFSFNIAPRIMIAYGYTPLYYRRVYDDGTYSGYELEYLLWKENNIVLKVPYVAQVALNPTSITGAPYPNPTFNVPAAKIAYGTYSDDLYQLIYKKFDRDFRDLPTMTAKVVIPDDNYISEDFRDRALIDSPNIHTGDVLGRVIKLSAYDPEKRTGEITFIPDNQISDDCIGFEVPNQCLNYPTLVITQVGTVYTLSLGGTYASTPDGEVYKWKYLQAFTWNYSNSVNTPIDNVEIIVIVPWNDECPPITLSGYIPVNKNPHITFSKDGNMLTAESDGDYGLTEDTTTIIYSLDGTNWILYQEPIDLSLITAENIIFRIQTTFTEVGSTPSDELEFSYNVSMHEDECPDPDLQAHPPTVAFSKVKNGTVYGYSLYKVGIYGGLDAIDYLRFREKGKYQEWVDYDNRILAQKLNGSMVIWEAQRVIVWCTNKGCPPYCSPIIEIDGGDYTDTLLSIAESGTTGVTNTHEQMWEHPDTPGLIEWKVEPLDDEIYHVPLVRTFIEQVGAATTNINERNFIWDRWNFKTEYIYTWNIDYKLNQLELHIADTGGIGAQIVVPLDITYESGQTNDYLTTAIESVINDYLSLQGYVKDVNYYLIVTITGTTTKTLKISFVAKHNPVDTWIGIYAGTDEMETESPAAVIVNVAGTKAEFQITTTSAPIVTNYSPYGTQFKVRLKVSTVNYFLDDSASNFNLLVALSPCPIVDEMMSAVITDTGKKFSLSASLTGCAGTSTFVWMYAGLEKGGSGKVISYTSSAIVYTNVIQDIKILGSCDSATHGTYEKLIRLTP